MAKIKSLKPLAAGLGAAVVASTLGLSTANAAETENPFATNELTSGYQLAGAEGKCGEGKCGDKSEEEGKCGDKTDEEGKCGEGKCGN